MSQSNDIEFVKIPVVEKERPLAVRLFNYSFWTTLIVLLLSFIFIDDQKNMLGKLSIFIIILLVVWGFMIKNPFKIIGHIIFKDNKIQFISDENTITFNVNELKEIKFEYEGYKGRVRILPLTLDSGLGNKLYFKSFDVEYNFELFLENHHVLLLRKIIRNWNANYNIS
ncbi:MAG: hypothetical protein EA412_04265 [Chitinophagaceae bacterium]|nr:MAG: hypothetical protein EA412_04265 [Chitinophagaceae bacterium]